MKKMTKLLCIILALAMMLLCLSACASSENAAEEPAEESEETPAEENGGESAEEPEEEPEEESAEEPSDAAAGGELLIGGVGPLTGDYAVYGTAARNGAQIAVDEINAAGGVNGMTLKLDYQDSAGDPESAVNAYGMLIDNGMDVCLGGVLSGENTSIVAAAKEDGILILTPSASADASIQGNDAAFRVCFQDSAQGTASAQYIAENDLPTEVAVFYQSDIDYSVGLYNAFEAEAANQGITIKEVQTFTEDTRTDFTTQINAIKDSGVELVFMPIYYAEAATFLTQASGKLPEGTIFFGCDGLDGILGEIADTADAENVMLLTPFAADDPDEAIQAFVATYEEQFGGTPNQFAADGYDAIYAIKAAVEQAGVTSPDDPELSSKLVAAMLEITVDGLTGEMTWTADGEPQKPAKAMIIHDGVATLFGADTAEEGAEEAPAEETEETADGAAEETAE